MKPTPEQIKAARERAALTQEQAAALLGAGRVTWTRYETGTRSLSPHEWAYWLHVAGLKRIPFKRRP
jgi:DNA-binding XRE family transcriptional regulator